MAVEAVEAAAVAEVTAACTAAVEEEVSAVAGAAQVEVAAVAAAGTAAGIQEIKEAEEREGNIPSSFFLADQAIDAYRFRGVEAIYVEAGK